MACKDCFTNCAVPTTDRCVEYTGPDVPILGICTGDQLSVVEAKVFDALLAAMNGTGITFDDLTIDCEFITEILDGEDENLANMIQALVTAVCQNKTSITNLETTVNAPFTVDASCLTLPTSPTRDDVLKAAVAKVCEVSTSISTVITDYVKASELCDSVQACLTAIDDGNGDTVVQEFSKMPKNVPMAYVGPMTVFDGTGKGLEASGYNKVYICNGNNGTPDLRGYSLIGANTNVVGPTLDVAVDPAQAINAGYSIVVGTKKGAYAETLTSLQFPPHSHSATTTPHSHLTVGTGSDTALTSNTSIKNALSTGGNLGYGLGGTATASIGRTSDTTVTVAVASTGGGQPHNNLHPSYGVVYIIYLP